MKELIFHVNDDVGEAFQMYCKMHHTRCQLRGHVQGLRAPEEALQALINLYGRTEIAIRKLRKGEVDRSEAFVHLKEMIKDAKKLCSYMILPMPYPLFCKLQGDLIKCLTSPGFRSEPAQSPKIS